MPGIEFQPFGQHLGQDGGGRHGQHAAQGQSASPIQAEKQGDPQHDQDGDQDLSGTQPEHDALHGGELGQAELQTDAEHEEHHAKFSQVFRSGRIGQPSQCVRANQEAYDQIADQRREFKGTKNYDHHHGGSEQQQHRVE